MRAAFLVGNGMIKPKLYNFRILKSIYIPNKVESWVMQLHVFLNPFTLVQDIEIETDLLIYLDLQGGEKRGELSVPSV